MSDNDIPFQIVGSTVQVQVRGEFRVVAVCHYAETAALIGIALHRMGCTAEDFELTPPGFPGEPPR